jgi:hypothetical protein
MIEQTQTEKMLKLERGLRRQIWKRQMALAADAEMIENDLDLLPSRRLSFPNSDHDLRCIVDLNGYALGYDLSRWADRGLIGFLTIHLEPEMGDVEQRYLDILVLLRTTPPASFVGTYISGRRIDEKADRYPAPTIDRARIQDSWLRPGENNIDLGNQAAAEGFADLIIEECAQRPAPLVFLDNIIHPSALKEWCSWRDTCGFLARVHEGLNAQGQRLIANIAVASWAMSAHDVDLLSGSVDGMSFEMPFHKNARGNQDRTRWQTYVYRKWLGLGKCVVLIALDSSLKTQEEKDDEAQLIAALAMMVRNPGDRLFVAWPFFRHTPDWADWPVRFGSPTGECEYKEGGVLARNFSNGRLEVNVNTREVAARIFGAADPGHKEGVEGQEPKVEGSKVEGQDLRPPDFGPRLFPGQGLDIGRMHPVGGWTPADIKEAELRTGLTTDAEETGIEEGESQKSNVESPDLGPPTLDPSDLRPRMEETGSPPPEGLRNWYGRAGFNI